MDHRAVAGTAPRASMPTRVARQHAQIARQADTATRRPRSTSRSRATSAPRATTATSLEPPPANAQPPAARAHIAGQEPSPASFAPREGMATSLAAGSSASRRPSARASATALRRAARAAHQVEGGLVTAQVMVQIPRPRRLHRQPRRHQHHRLLQLIPVRACHPRYSSEGSSAWSAWLSFPFSRLQSTCTPHLPPKCKS